MRPVRYVRDHPLATILAAAGGMIVGPAVLGAVNRWTGVNVRLPSVGS